MSDDIKFNQKQRIILDTLQPEDKKWFNHIVTTHQKEMFTISFPMNTLELSKQSFIRMYILREFWYEIFKLEELPTSIAVTFKIV